MLPQPEKAVHISDKITICMDLFQQGQLLFQTVKDILPPYMGHGNITCLAMCPDRRCSF